MPPDVTKLLRDVVDAGEAIQQYVRGRSLQDYLSDRGFRDQVQWNFCVIGEALSRLKTLDLSTYDQISENWKIVGFRNQLIHGYGSINNEITWSIIHTKLPILMAEARQLLSP